MLKTLFFTVVGAVYTSPGVELAAGDEATIFLDQARNPSLPASIAAIVQTVQTVNVNSSGCVAEGRKYGLQYETADLEDAVTALADCDVASIAGTSCCETLRLGLAAAVEAIDDLEEDLDTWDVVDFSGVPTNGSPGVPDQELQTAVGTITGSGTLIATVTGVDIVGSPLAIPFNVDAGDVPSVWAAKAAGAIGANAAVAAFYEGINAGADFGLLEKVPNGSDITLNVAIAAGTATGITPDGTGTHAVIGVAAVTPDPVPARIGQRGRWGNRWWTAGDLYTWIEEVNEFNGILDYGFTGPLGGTPTSLDSLPVNSEMAGLNTVVIGGAGIHFYGLDAGTTAENSPLVVRPDNYAGGTNEFIWNFKPAVTLSSAILDASSGQNGASDADLVPLYGGAGDLNASVQILVKSIASGFTWALLNDSAQLTASRNTSPPDATGTLGLFQSVVVTTPLTGATITASRYVDQSHFITPAGTLAALTFTLPAAANARLGQVVKVWITQAITALTVNVSGGGTILGTAFAAAAYTLGTPLTYECVSVAGLGIWTRRQ